MKAYVFPGQGAQFTGMGKDLYNSSSKLKDMFQKANSILKFKITDIMFDGTEEELKQTNVTQPAVFLHSVILAHALGEEFKPDMVAGHSLGEFSALVASRALTFEDGLRLVAKRADAMQKACMIQESTMAAILGLEDNKVENICSGIDEIVVPANYNSPGQLVISGSVEGINQAIAKCNDAGAKRALQLKVGGAFHSPLMEPARVELAEAINNTRFSKGICPIYQNVTGQSVNDPEIIKSNLISQLTAPVMWTKIMQNMIADGAKEVIEVGPGKVLQGLFKKIDRKFAVSSATI
ncbi:MAG: [acyl-carrier-protein] S-malonyltransferase [Marinilabiliales bacterium]|nr:MAG: [acyl-carrier-protein] S-malonyltransferase [Marinilabiliales bacterium]